MHWKRLYTIKYYEAFYFKCLLLRILKLLPQCAMFYWCINSIWKMEPEKITQIEITLYWKEITGMYIYIYYCENGVQLITLVKYTVRWYSIFISIQHLVYIYRLLNEYCTILIWPNNTDTSLRVSVSLGHIDILQYSFNSLFIIYLVNILFTCLILIKSHICEIILDITFGNIHL